MHGDIENFDEPDDECQFCGAFLHGTSRTGYCSVSCEEQAQITEEEE